MMNINEIFAKLKKEEKFEYRKQETVKFYCSNCKNELLESKLENENIEMKLKPSDNIKNFLQERWNGLRPALWGGQLREAELTRAIYLSTLNFDGESYEA